MNYIEQLNGFWDKVQTENNLKPSAIAIYMALLQINNKCAWVERFTVDYDRVITMAGLTKNTYYAGVKELVAGGYIQYKPGPNQYMSAVFQIEVLNQNLGKQQVKQRESNRSSRGKATGQAEGILIKQVNNETSKQLNNEEVVVDNARTQEFENAINDYFNPEQPTEEKEKSCAQKEKELPTLDEAVRYIEATANWTRNVFEHYLYVGQDPGWDKLTEDQKQMYYDQRLKLFKYFYEQKEDTYRVRYPTSSEMSSNFYFWISTIKRLNKLNGILNGNGESELTIDKFKNTFTSKSTAKDKRSELLNLTEQSQQFLRSTAG